MPDNAGSDRHKPTSLRGIAITAASNKQHRFRNLYGLLNRELLYEGWKRLNKQAASGVDKVTAKEYSQNLFDNLSDLERRLKEKQYKAKLIRRSYIPKENGKQRPLGIPALEDKIVQAACQMILTAIYEEEFLNSSYGYRLRRGAEDAVSDLTFQLRYGVYGYVVEADVKGFFDNIDHEWLLEMLGLRIDDKAFLQLIRKWLKAGILMPEGEVIYPETGSPQGGLVSPILSNIYLHFVLDLWFEKVVKPQCRGEALLCRFADDWVCAFRFQEDAERFYRCLPERLRKFNLTLETTKSGILRFSRFHPSRKRRFTFLGFEFSWFPDRAGTPRVQRRTARKKLQAAEKRLKEWIKENRHLKVGDFFKALNIKLRGYYNYYGVRGNFDSLLRFHRHVRDLCFKWLNRRSQRRSYNGEGFKQMLKYVNMVMPKITEKKRLHTVVLERR